MQWTEELNELGSPLFLAEDDEALLRLESFVGRYPEIQRVSYFAKDGTALFSVDNRDDIEPAIDLGESRLEDAIAVIGEQKPYLMNSGLINPRQFEILAPVWAESMAEAGLFDFDPAQVDAQTRTELMGFVGIQLDFVMFHDQLLAILDRDLPRTQG